MEQKAFYVAQGFRPAMPPGTRIAPPRLATQPAITVTKASLRNAPARLAAGSSASASTAPPVRPQPPPRRRSAPQPQLEVAKEKLEEDLVEEIAGESDDGKHRDKHELGEGAEHGDDGDAFGAADGDDVDLAAQDKFDAFPAEVDEGESEAEPIDIDEPEELAEQIDDSDAEATVKCELPEAVASDEVWASVQECTWQQPEPEPYASAEPHSEDSFFDDGESMLPPEHAQICHSGQPCDVCGCRTYMKCGYCRNSSCDRCFLPTWQIREICQEGKWEREQQRKRKDDDRRAWQEDKAQNKAEQAQLRYQCFKNYA